MVAGRELAEDLVRGPGGRDSTVIGRVSIQDICRLAWLFTF